MRIGAMQRLKGWKSLELTPRQLSFGALRVAPWVVFGPITGVMSEAAIGCFRRGRPVLGSFWIAANVSILLGMPILTAMIASRL